MKNSFLDMVQAEIERYHESKDNSSQCCFRKFCFEKVMLLAYLSTLIESISNPKISVMFIRYRITNLEFISFVMSWTWDCYTILWENFSIFEAEIIAITLLYILNISGYFSTLYKWVSIIYTHQKHQPKANLIIWWSWTDLFSLSSIEIPRNFQVHCTSSLSGLNVLSQTPDFCELENLFENARCVSRSTFLTN